MCCPETGNTSLGYTFECLEMGAVVGAFEGVTSTCKIISNGHFVKMGIYTQHKCYA